MGVLGVPAACDQIDLQPGPGGCQVVTVLVEVWVRHDPADPHRATRLHQRTARRLRDAGMTCTWEDPGRDVDGLDCHLSRWETAVPTPGAAAALAARLRGLALSLYPDGDGSAMLPLATDEVGRLAAMGIPIETPDTWRDDVES